MQPKVELYTVTVAFIPSFTLSFTKWLLSTFCVPGHYIVWWGWQDKEFVSVSRDPEGQQCRLRVNDSNNVIYGVKVRGVLQDPQEVEDPHRVGSLLRQASPGAPLN